MVDYYYNKKLAYNFVKRAQQPVCLTFSEPLEWRQSLVACNDTRSGETLSYRVTDAPAVGREILAGSGRADADSSTPLASIAYSSGEKHLYLIEWQHGDVRGLNHYLAGNTPFDYRGLTDAMKANGCLRRTAYLNDGCPKRRGPVKEGGVRF